MHGGGVAGKERMWKDTSIGLYLMTLSGRRDLILDTYFYYTDYKNNLTRIPKDSAKWFHAFIKGQGQASGFTLLHHIIKLC